MIPRDFYDKPINGDYILIETWGDLNNYVLCHYSDSNVKNMTNITCSVFNMRTDKLSDKSVYLHKSSGRLYMNTRNNGKIWLDEFKNKGEAYEVHGK